MEIIIHTPESPEQITELAEQIYLEAITHFMANLAQTPEQKLSLIKQLISALNH